MAAELGAGHPSFPDSGLEGAGLLDPIKPWAREPEAGFQQSFAQA
jgi:hypothetical protein